MKIKVLLLALFFSQLAISMRLDDPQVCCKKLRRNYAFNLGHLKRGPHGHWIKEEQKVQQLASSLQQLCIQYISRNTQLIGQVAQLPELLRVNVQQEIEAENGRKAFDLYIRDIFSGRLRQ